MRKGEAITIRSWVTPRFRCKLARRHLCAETYTHKHLHLCRDPCMDTCTCTQTHIQTPAPAQTPHTDTCTCAWTPHTCTRVQPHPDTHTETPTHSNHKMEPVFLLIGSSGGGNETGRVPCDLKRHSSFRHFSELAPLLHLESS